MATAKIHQFTCLSDNFGVLIHDPDTGVTASIDAPEAAVVERERGRHGWPLTHILVTHHHQDHVGGVAELKASTRCKVIGPKGEADKVPGIDLKVGEGDSFKLGSLEVRVIDTPGHTIGHISYWVPAAKAVFVGDTLFSIGCGRLLEGDARMMWSSLSKLMALPPETSFYCGHEYTLSNAKFAMTIDPDNEALRTRLKEVEALRAAGKPTLPATIGAELKANPFLRAGDQGIRKRLGMEGRADYEVFGEIRSRKDKG